MSFATSIEALARLFEKGDVTPDEQRGAAALLLAIASSVRQEELTLAGIVRDAQEHDLRQAEPLSWKAS